jgi:hypothetical protein
MTLVTRVVILLWIALAFFSPLPSRAQSTGETISLAGDWRIGGPDGSVVTIEQKSDKVSGIWKKWVAPASYRGTSCTGDTWFDGKVSGDRVTGYRYLCPSKNQQPLDMKVVNQNRLEMYTLAPGGSGTTTVLNRARE